MNPLTYILILVIRFYRNFLVGDNPPIECNYEPSCSEYTIRALEEHGLIEGVLLGWKRISSCTDSNKLEPTYDPVPKSQSDL